MIALAGLLSACATSPTLTTSEPEPVISSPEAAVQGLTAALAVGEWDAAHGFADETQVALLISIEGIAPEVTARMLRDGIPLEVASNFWRSFAEGFLSFSQEEMSQVLVGNPTRFEVEGISFGSVSVGLRHHAGVGSWVVREENGSWLVDLFATFGPSLAHPLRLWLQTVPDDDHGRLIRAELAAQEPSFTTALTHKPLGEVSDGARFEVLLLMSEAKG